MSDKKPNDKKPEEQRTKAVFNFLHLQPPGRDHQKLIRASQDYARHTGADHHLFISHKKNPLTHTDRMKFVNETMPDVVVHRGSPIQNPVEAVKTLGAKGYQHVTMITGANKHRQVSNLLHKYNGNEYQIPHLAVKAGVDVDPDSKKPKEKKSLRKESMYSDKAVFVVGGPGSGKDFIVKSLIEENGLVELPLDKLVHAILSAEDIEDLNEGHAVIINGNADVFEKIEMSRVVLEEMGYDTSMVYVYTDDQESKDRNDARLRDGHKTITEEARSEKYQMSVENVAPFSERFAPFFVFDNSHKIESLTEEQAFQVGAWLNELHDGINEFLNGQDINSLFEATVLDMAVKKKERTIPPGDKTGGIPNPDKNRAEHVVAEDVKEIPSRTMVNDKSLKGRPKKGAKVPGEGFDSRIGTVPSGGIGLTAYTTEGKVSFRKFIGKKND